MQLGNWNLTHREDGDYSLYEILPASDGAEQDTNWVERARFSVHILWLVLAVVKNLLIWSLDASIRAKQRKKRRDGQR